MKGWLGHWGFSVKVYPSYKIKLYAYNQVIITFVYFLLFRNPKFYVQTQLYIQLNNYSVTQKSLIIFELYTLKIVVVFNLKAIMNIVSKYFLVSL